MIKLYFNPAHSTFLQDRKAPKKEDLTFIAEIDTVDLGTAFKLSNLASFPSQGFISWTCNKEVKLAVGFYGYLRSASAGDVFEKDNAFYLIAASGFLELDEHTQWRLYAGV